MNFSKFLRTPFLQNTSGQLLLQLDCFICPKDMMIIVVLLQIMGDGKVRWDSFMLGFGMGDIGVDILYFLFSVLFLCFC